MRHWLTNPWLIAAATAPSAWLEGSPGLPVSEFMYHGKSYPVFSSIHSHFKPTDHDLGKFNRFAKLGNQADTIENKMEDSVRKSPDTLDGKCAFLCLLMMRYGIRVGNEDSAAGYESQLLGNPGEFVQTFGASTLQNKHVMIDGEDGPRPILRLEFLGKKQVEQQLTVDDPLLVQTGQRYKQGGAPEDLWVGVDQATVTKYIVQTVGAGFSPKDLRTFCANIKALDYALGYYDGQPHTNPKDISEHVGYLIGNTPAVARQKYIDNRLFEWLKE